MEDLDLMRLALNTCQSALDEQIVFRNYLIGALGVLGSVVAYLFVAYKSSVDKQIELAKSGFELVESVKAVKEASEKQMDKFNKFELSLKDNKCIYVPSNKQP